MKRNFLTIILFLINFTILFSDPIDLETAKTVAKNFMNQKRNVSNEILNVEIELFNGSTSFFVINFVGGGWVMVSSDNTTIPVLGYNLSGTYFVNDLKPEPFVDWLNGYKEQILTSSSLKSSNVEVISKWGKLLNNNQLQSSAVYIPGRSLLNVPGRGHVEWSQDRNNSATCTPAYNKYCSEGSGTGCDCDKKPLGCGAVAMGQIMWYWQWPNSSSYRTYNWSLMPSILSTFSSTAEGDEVAHLLKDCGSASDMDYNCWGSWTTINEIVDAFKNSFNYKAVKKHVQSEWDYGDAWLNLLRSEIDAERPVLYRGDECDLCGDKHIFVLDGYDASDPNYFWFNFGWGYPGNSYNISRQYLGDLTPGENNYNKNQMAVVGISPTYDETLPDKVNITDVSYSIVSGTNVEEAQQIISLPSTGKTLTVTNGGNLTLISGKSITLNSGFKALNGSIFEAEINPRFSTDPEMNIIVPLWANGFTPNGDGINDEFCLNVENANSWEFQVFDSYSGAAIFQSAGSITGNKACMWNGDKAQCLGAYACIIRFKNNFGRELENAYMIYAICGLKSAKLNTDSIIFNKAENISSLSNMEECKLHISPNPNNGIFTVNCSNCTMNNLSIINSIGEVIIDKRNYLTNNFEIDLRNYPIGVYVLKVEINNEIIIRKIVKNI